jgi:hypothetical protein
LEKTIAVIEDTPLRLLGPLSIRAIISTVLIGISEKLLLILAFKER